MIKNKEVTDALCLLLHCSLKDEKYETQKQQFDLIYNYIEKIERQNEIKDAYLDIIYDMLRTCFAAFVVIQCPAKIHLLLPIFYRKSHLHLQ